MDEFLEKIKEILESEVSILIENVDDVVSLLKERGSSKKKIVDDRWKSLTKLLNFIQDKDENFYAKIIETIGINIIKEVYMSMSFLFGFQKKRL